MNRDERHLQQRVSKWFRERGHIVLKTSPGVLNPVGIPDLLVLANSQWFALEIKASKASPFQPLQREQIALLQRRNPHHVFVVHPDNWEVVSKKITRLLSDD